MIILICRKKDQRLIGPKSKFTERIFFYIGKQNKAIKITHTAILGSIFAL